MSYYQPFSRIQGGIHIKILISHLGRMSINSKLKKAGATSTTDPMRALQRGIVAMYSRSAPFRLYSGWSLSFTINTISAGILFGPEEGKVNYDYY